MKLSKCVRRHCNACLAQPANGREQCPIIVCTKAHTKADQPSRAIALRLEGIVYWRARSCSLFVCIVVTIARAIDTEQATGASRIEPLARTERVNKFGRRRFRHFNWFYGIENGIWENVFHFIASTTTFDSHKVPTHHPPPRYHPISSAKRCRTMARCVQINGKKPTPQQFNRRAWRRWLFGPLNLSTIFFT